MKILLINNNTRHINNLHKSLIGHDVEVVEYVPGVKLDSTGQDLVILSGGGGEGREATDRHKGDLWYRDELQFILDNNTPMIGICMGFELICHAYGSSVEALSKGVDGLKEIELLNGMKVQQVESHDWGIFSVSKDLKVVGYSDTGIEIVKHKAKPLLGTQFHPELTGSLSLARLFSSVI